VSANATLLAMCLVSLALHAAASRLHFVSPAGTPPGMRGIACLFLVCGAMNVSVLASASIDWRLAAVALGLYVVALALFLAAIHANRAQPLSVVFSRDQPTHLVAIGPYRLMRHPFYGSYCLTWLAGAIGAFSPVLLTCALVMFIVYVRAARFEERKFLSSSLAREYARYRATTGVFAPRTARR
jgi:protein-S-isoprenylcysteine O-methyltransferase Ste14